METNFIFKWSLKVLYLHMLSFRSIFAVLLIGFTFLGNIGMNVYTHSCKKNGDSHSYFIQLDDECKEHHNSEAEKLPLCCRKIKQDQEDITSIKDDCCSDQVDLFAVQMNYFSDSETIVPYFHSALIQTESISKVFFNPIFKNKKEQICDPPPKPIGQEILILNQVFRI